MLLLSLRSYPCHWVATRYGKHRRAKGPMDLAWHRRSEVFYLPFLVTFLATLAICMFKK